MNEQKSERRIVSRGEYAGQVANKSIWAFGSIVFKIFGGAACLLGFGRLIMFMIAFLANCLNPQPSSGMHAIDVISVLGAVVAGTASIYGAKYLENLADATKVDVPITRSNVGLLPDQESLVRPSQKNIEQQQAILLRAASQSDTTPPDQLVRPAR